MQTTQTAQFQTGELVKHKVSKRVARVTRHDDFEGEPYAVLKLCRKLYSGNILPVYLHELEAEWEYAKPRPNPARKELALVKNELIGAYVALDEAYLECERLRQELAECR